MSDNSQPISGRDILQVGGVVLGAVVLLKVYNGIADLFGDDDDEEQDPRLPPGMEPGDITEPPTISAQMARWIADGVYGAIYGDGSVLWGSNTENEGVVMTLLLQAQNDADVLAIADAYGNRSGSWSWTGSLDLFGVVAEYLSEGDIEEINNEYRQRGIHLLFSK